MKTPCVLLLSLPTDRFQQGFPASGCRPQRGTGTGAAREVAAYSHPCTEQQHLNLVLHLIPTVEEVSVFHRPQVASELTACLVTDYSAPCFVTSHLQSSGKSSSLV